VKEFTELAAANAERIEELETKMGRLEAQNQALGGYLTRAETESLIAGDPQVRLRVLETFRKSGYRYRENDILVARTSRNVLDMIDCGLRTVHHVAD
jgi:type II secretory pathway component PulJ